MEDSTDDQSRFTMADNNSGGAVYDWSAFRDDSGQIFYHNSKTDETSWDQPPKDESFNPVEEEKEETTSGADQAETEPSDTGEWAKYMDEDKGEPYYFNTMTQETVWEKPAGFVGGGSTAKMSPKITSKEAVSTKTTKAKTESQEAGAPDIAAAAATGDWMEIQDDEGRTYYYNSKTEATSWDRPADFKEKTEKIIVSETKKGMVEDAPVKDKEQSTEGGDWTQVQDDEGPTYYYNTKTEETSWDRPEGFGKKNKDANSNAAQEEQKEKVPETKETKAFGYWTEVQDDEGQTYYYNTKTEQTSWDRPDEFEQKENGRDVVEAREKDKVVSEKDDDGTPVGTEDKMVGDWAELQDKEGRTYYNNTKTGKTSWDKSDDFEKEIKDGDANEKEKKEEDWVETQDDEGRTYYYNTKTEMTLWERPAALEKKDSGVSPVRPTSPDSPTKNKAKKEASPVAINSEAAADWVETQDDDEGRTYYYNVKTEETTWEKPEGFDNQKKNAESSGISPVRPQSPSEEENKGPVMPGNWVEYEDDEGRLYYYNSETQQTVWDKPADFDDGIVKSPTEGDISEDDAGAIELSPIRPRSPDGTSPASMEVEEEEEVVDPVVKRLEEANEALSQSDAIMETGTYFTHLLMMRRLLVALGKNIAFNFSLKPWILG